MAEDRQLRIDYGAIENFATQIDTKNGELLTKLEEIKTKINSLAGSWESDSATTIRNKITGMQPRFEQYHSIVNNYVVFLRNMVDMYKSTESTNTSAAEEFI